MCHGQCRVQISKRNGLLFFPFFFFSSCKNRRYSALEESGHVLTIAFPHLDMKGVLTSSLILAAVRRNFCFLITSSYRPPPFVCISRNWDPGNAENALRHTHASISPLLLLFKVLLRQELQSYQLFGTSRNESKCTQLINYKDGLHLISRYIQYRPYVYIAWAAHLIYWVFLSYEMSGHPINFN